jgi:hypothetical protein
MKLDKRRIVYEYQSPRIFLEWLCTYRLDTHLCKSVRRDDGFLKRLDFKVIVIPYPHKRLPAELCLRAVRTAELLQHWILGFEFEGCAGHALDSIRESAVLGSAMGRSQEDNPRC